MAPRCAALCFAAASTGRGRGRSGASPSRGFLVVSCDGRRSEPRQYSSLAAKILGSPTSFNAAKLKVEFVGGGEQATFPRAYTLSHCDLTAQLTLAVSVSERITASQLRRWRRKKDDVLAEWKEMAGGGGEATLHVHCYVSGGGGSLNLLQELAAGFRYYVFSKELPLVLKAVVHGDAALFAEQPELMEATVWVHFHSTSAKYNRIECWGPLRDAAKRNLLLQVDDPLHQLQSAITTTTNTRRRRWATPETIFNALLALLL